MDGPIESLPQPSTSTNDLPHAFSSSFWNFDSLDPPSEETSDTLGSCRPANKPATSPSFLTTSSVPHPSVSPPSSIQVLQSSTVPINVPPNELTPPPSAQCPQSSSAFVPHIDASTRSAEAEPGWSQAAGPSLFGDGLKVVSDGSHSGDVSHLDTVDVVQKVDGTAHATDAASGRSERTPSPSVSIGEGEGYWDGDDDSEAAQALRYDFRLAPRVRPLAGGATWLDQDQSGDYDPSQKVARFAPRLVRRRKRKELDNEGDILEGEEDRVATKRIRNYYYARQAGDRLIIRLKLGTEEGKAKLKEYDDSIPPGYDENDSWNFLLDDDDEQSGEQSSSDSEKPRHLRNRLREAKGKSLKRFTRDSSQSVPEQSIGLGHPAARGCKACHSLGQACPMLEPDGTYPCYLCIEDDCDCEPLVEPLKKRSCERCRKRRVRCSYLDTKEHSGPCEGCQDAGIRCVAGPAIDAHRTRVGHDGKPATIHEKEPQYKRSIQAQRLTISKDPHPQSQSRYLTCIHCKKNGKHCNIRRSKVELPCHSCRMSGAQCMLREKTTELPTSTWHKARLVQLKTAKRNPTVVECGPGELNDEAAQHFRQLAAKAQDSSRSQSPLPFPPAQSRAFKLGPGLIGGLLTPKTPAQFINKRTAPIPVNIMTISTRLLHPLKFNAPACNWCEDPIFGILGIGTEISVKVRLWPDGRGCTELSRAASSDSSSMCPNCTMERVLVLTCDGHRLRPIRGITKEMTDITAALEALEISKLGFERKRAEARLCSICPAVAAFECYTTPESGTPGETEDSGCGLRLCDTCACLFDELYGRDLNAMVTQINGADAESYPEGLRADYGFFARNSFLVKQVLDD